VAGPSPGVEVPCCKSSAVCTSSASSLGWPGTRVGGRSHLEGVHCDESVQEEDDGEAVHCSLAPASDLADPRNPDPGIRDPEVGGLRPGPLTSRTRSVSGPAPPSAAPCAPSAHAPRPSPGAPWPPPAPCPCPGSPGSPSAAVSDTPR